MKQLFVAVTLGVLFTCNALADETGGAIFRLKSGINYPQENGDVTHFTPLAVDGIYRLTESLGLGLHAMYSTGSHSIGTVQGSNLALLNLSKKMLLTLASGDYFFSFGNARIGLGVKAGALFYSDTTTLAAGLSNTVLPADNSKTVFTAGPTLDFDLPVKGAWFMNVGGDYMISENHYHFGSLYVGVGINI